MDIDIQFILAQLKDAGLTQGRIADEMGVSQPTISNLSRVKDGTVRPSYTVIDGLKKLAKKYRIKHKPPMEIS